jgi:predicted nucleic acid-binding protein
VTTSVDPATADAQRLHGARQVTDAYLLALAVSRGGRFVTLERKLAISAVPAAKGHRLHVI